MLTECMVGQLPDDVFFVLTLLHPLNCCGELWEEKDEQSRAMILIVLREMVAAATGCRRTSWGGVSYEIVGRREGPMGKSVESFL